MTTSRLLLADGSGRCAIPTGLIVRGELQPPPSKSLTQRALTLALLARGTLTVERPLLADDTRLLLAALTELGCEVEEREEAIRVRPRLTRKEAEIRCGHNGTMLRFLTAALSTLEGLWLLDGSERLRQRPMGPLVAALTELGARIEYLGVKGYAPLRVYGGRLRGGYVELDARQSSQFASALLLAAANASQEVVVRLSSLTSAPYLELTLDSLGALGVRVERLGEMVYRIKPGDLPGGSLCIEADFSAAAYPAAAALLTAGTVQLTGLTASSKQGDRGFLEILQRMGAQVSWTEDGLLVEGRGEMQAVDVDLGEMPDQVPTLAALAPFAHGNTVIRNVAHLRLKESDRLAAMATELRRLGAEVVEEASGLVIAGCWARGPVPAEKVVVDSHGDHRIAMSLAICGLRRPGVIVDQPLVVTKSYPRFWRDLESLLSR